MFNKLFKKKKSPQEEQGKPRISVSTIHSTPYHSLETAIVESPSKLQLEEGKTLVGELNGNCLMWMFVENGDLQVGVFNSEIESETLAILFEAMYSVALENERAKQAIVDRLSALAPIAERLQTDPTRLFDYQVEDRGLEEMDDWDYEWDD